MVKLIIFDFDGTLADTNAGIIETEQETLLRLGLPPGDPEKMKLGIGLPLRASLQMGLGVSDELLDRAVEIYRAAFYDVALYHITIFDGVVDFLEECRRRGIRCAIATSRGRHSLQLLLDKYGLSGYFCDMVTADDEVAAKPAPDMVLYLLDKLSEEAGDTVVIGDTTFDIMMGKGAHCRTCGVTYGNHPRQMLDQAAPDWIIDDMMELSKLI